ncbi:MAG: hypothetical protein KKA16_08735 [Alphaproteobacteria bacterium]|nr:hypothetical protein [Alphaproteobacteria bacterium]
MLKCALLVVAAVSLAACASTPASYARIDASPEQHRLDSADCTHQARTNAPVPEVRSLVPSHPDIPETSRYALRNTERAAQVQANIYHRCMTSRGYARAV